MIKSGHKYLLQRRNHSYGILLKHYTVYRTIDRVHIKYFGIKFYICCRLFGPWKARQALPSELVHGDFGVCSELVWD